MQENYPDLENDIENALIQYIFDISNHKSHVMSRVEQHRIFEGGRSTILREGGDEHETIMRNFSSESTIPKSTILYGSLEDLFAHFKPVGTEMASDKSRMMLDALDKAVEKSGNVVDGKGKPFSKELYLEVLEKIQIDFDSEGRPIMPTLVVHPEMKQRIDELMSDVEDRDFKNKMNALIGRKRAEWRAREADRILVG